MLASALFAVASALGAMAAPTGAFTNFRRFLEERQMSNSTMTGPTDVDILQYALTLEHLEAYFYANALETYSAQDFENAGFPEWVRGRISQIAGHEAAHVALLEGALGSAAVAPCNYSFPYTDPRSFVTLAQVIENVGVSAYSGAAMYITEPAYVTVAATILTTEARHQTWEYSAALQGYPWSGPFDTPLGLDMVYTLAAQFITGCPSTNAALPVMAFSPLTIADTTCAGKTTQFTFDDPHNATNYAVFYSGLSVTTVQLDENDMAMIPADLQGYVFVVISTEGNSTMVAPDNIVAGVGLLNIPIPALGNNTNNA